MSAVRRSFLTRTYGQICAASALASNACSIFIAAAAPKGGSEPSRLGSHCHAARDPHIRGGIRHVDPAAQLREARSEVSRNRTRRRPRETVVPPDRHRIALDQFEQPPSRASLSDCVAAQPLVSPEQQRASPLNG